VLEFGGKERIARSNSMDSGDPQDKLRLLVVREQATFAVRVKSVALLFEPLDISGSKAGTQIAHTCGGELDLVRVFQAATD
jgi:hypothetical protein